MSLQTQLRGTGVALITPFKASGDVDYDALGKVIDHVINGKVEYIVSLGTTGETPTLDKAERNSVIKYTYLCVNKRVPVVVGIGGNNTKEVVNELQSFPLEEATAILSASPYYSKPSQQGIYEHYKLIAQESPLPVLLYNVPGRTGRNMEAATTLKLAHEVENIVGIKEAAGDMLQCMKILRDKPKDFLVVSGDDALVFPQIACGMEGIISVAANALPEEFSEMIRECLRGDLIEAKIMNDKLIEAYELMFAENNPAGVKAFMNHLGLIGNNLRLPVTPVSEELNNKIRAYLLTR